MSFDCDRFDSLLRIWIKVSDHHLDYLRLLTGSLSLLLDFLCSYHHKLSPCSEIFDGAPELGSELTSLSVWSKIDWALKEVRHYVLFLTITEKRHYRVIAHEIHSIVKHYFTYT